MSRRLRASLIAVGGVVAAAAWVFAATRLWRTSVPAGLDVPELDPRRYFTASELEEGADYQTFLRVDELLARLAQVAALAVFAVRGARFARESAAGRIGTGMLLGMLGLAFVWFAQLPFDAAALWWERRHDVTDLGYVEWLLDDWLAAGGPFLFISFGLLVVMGLAGVLRRWWWAAAAPVVLVVGLGFVAAQPYLLPGQWDVWDPSLQADAGHLVAATGTEGVDVRVMGELDGLGGPNAAAAGALGSERVILWESLVVAFPRPELQVVLAHELGHHAKDHLLETLAWYALLAVPLGLLVELATRRRGGLYEPASVPLALLVVVSAMFLLSPVNSALSRRHETEADWVALQATRDPAAARRMHARFTRIARDDPRPPAWSRALDSHPSALERIALAEAWRARRRSGR